MAKVAFSIVGFGHAGQRHAEHIREQGELVSVCDIDSRALDKVSSLYPDVWRFSSIEEMLENDHRSSVVNICTPNGLHAVHTIKALQSDKHVVCEKPMALTVKDCEAMIREADKNNKKLFVVKQNRFNPPVLKLKECLDQGRLGRIFSAQCNCFWNRNDRYYQESSWKGTRDMDGGILFTQFSHFIDLLYWFLGDVEDVSVLSDNYSHTENIDFEDTLVALIKFKSRILATLNCTINSYSKNMEGSITLFGEKGTVKIGGQYLNVLEYHTIENYVIEEIEDRRPANDYGFYQGSMSNHDKKIANVIDVLTNDGEVISDGYNGLKTVEIIEKIYAKIR